MTKFQARTDRQMFWQDVQCRLQRLRLNSLKLERKGFRLGLVSAVLVLLLFGSGLRFFATPQAKFIRVPDNNITENVDVAEIPELASDLLLEDLNVTVNVTSLPPPTSVLHPNTPRLDPLNPDIPFSIKIKSGPFLEYSESFPQHGKTEPGQHYRIESNNPLARQGKRERDSVLIITVLNDAESWGQNRSVSSFFDLVDSFDYPKHKISIALLTSSVEEFSKAKHLFQRCIHRYPRLSVIFRNDFAQDGLTRENRHADSLQNNRRRMLARYRNYALMSTLESWHQHVLWLDADIDMIPSGLLLKMIQSDLDVLEPMCVRKFTNDNDDWYDYDLNAWMGQRKVRPADHEGDFVPGNLNAKNLHDLVDESAPIVPLDSVGGSMLYIRADVHRQGVLFPSHYVIGSEWDAEGYDGIETEGLCYIAHFLGFKCWGMPNDIIFHAT